MIDHGMNFERVIETLLFEKPEQTQHTYAGMYDHQDKEVRALLYALCVKQEDFYSDKYSTEELEQLQEYRETLLKEGDDHQNLVNCIEFFHSKLNK